MSPKRPESLTRPDDDEFEQLSPRSAKTQTARKPGMSAKAKAMSLLARREHSQLELQRKLAAKGYPDEDIAQALSWVKDHHFQSDSRFVQSVVRRRAPSMGDRAIAHELAQHGLSGSGKANSIPSVHTESDDEPPSERQRAFEWLQRRFASLWAQASSIEDSGLRRQAQLQAKAKALRNLAARGFEAGNASKAWRDFTEASEPEA